MPDQRGEDGQSAPIYESDTVERLAVAKEFNAKVWASEFIAAVKRTPEMPYDHETVLSWFAVAIMAGYGQGRDDEAAGVSTEASDA